MIIEHVKDLAEAKEYDIHCSLVVCRACRPITEGNQVGQGQFALCHKSMS